MARKVGQIVRRGARHLQGTGNRMACLELRRGKRSSRASAQRDSAASARTDACVRRVDDRAPYSRRSCALRRAAAPTRSARASTSAPIRFGPA